MEKGIFKELMKKYAAGHSTLEEEAFLIKNLTDKKSLETQWLRYVNGKKKIPAADLNAKVLEAINKKEKKSQSRKLVAGFMSIAASLLLLLIFFRPEPIPETKSLAEKEALLKKALAMFDNNSINKKNKKVLYEDDLIIIYSSK
ncbi:hypothetical protein [Cyclobacterium marinum]|uniref:Uncharacterized protein n=1 Tax=Cyclobacterium marinum (strain ATCC 25205 / DSM 745 / LMG 13164 / NCIMB 1802) TaxID=880070 RepID=G0J8B1_CYCMS|nr:hypothetical protein [Cyclobacterium marinum]AEL28711.1 hypothetical protein Cycma_5027 [Cyclobacterium marinum DSM 745]